MFQKLKSVVVFLKIFTTLVLSRPIYSINFEINTIFNLKLAQHTSKKLAIEKINICPLNTVFASQFKSVQLS